jgi:tetratricopeptide (TPR) repeat protein
VDNSLTFPILDYRLAEAIDIEADWDAESLEPAEATYHLGEILSRIGRVSDSRVYLERSVALNPDFDKPLVRLAAMAESDGNAEEAVRLLERATGTFWR